MLKSKEEIEEIANQVIEQEKQDKLHKGVEQWVKAKEENTYGGRDLGVKTDKK